MAEEDEDDSPFTREDIDNLVEARADLEVTVVRLKKVLRRGRPLKFISLWIGIFGSLMTVGIVIFTGLGPGQWTLIGIYAFNWLVIGFDRLWVTPQSEKALEEAESTLDSIDDLIALMLQFNQLTANDFATPLQAQQFNDQVQALSRRMGEEETDGE